MEKKHGVNGFPQGIVTAESKGDIGEASADLGEWVALFEFF